MGQSLKTAINYLLIWLKFNVEPDKNGRLCHSNVMLSSMGKQFKTNPHFILVIQSICGGSLWCEP